MSAPIKYHLSITSKPYKLASTPVDLNAEEYKALTVERVTAEERYDNAMGKHKEWKTMKTKEAQAEQKLEKEWLWLEVKEQQQRLDLEKKVLEETIARKELDDLAKAKKNEENEKCLVATGHQPLGSEEDSESDLTDPKPIVMVELRRRHKIAEGKKKDEFTET
ncbi:uncharacterized protein ARMOST_10073 [Armillaria ostoyae]|uniref:Uncharacterized protein n=1 Tax=Armillaria ostoyae TaxID=47428 RepID=A0A284RDA1_ARMOS|nr:uncharacterized protein ARMOST_10073 [Armillaria ostoyae]